MLIRHRHFDPHRTYLHGGPRTLIGGKLRRHGRGGHDAGALFFAENTDSGLLYASLYTRSTGTIWIAKIGLTRDQVFDLSIPAHAARLRAVLSEREMQAVTDSARHGSVDWAAFDEEQLSEAGFRGAWLTERSSLFGRTVDVKSVAVFDAADVTIVGEVPTARVERTYSQSALRTSSR